MGTETSREQSKEEFEFRALVKSGLGNSGISAGTSKDTVKSGGIVLLIKPQILIK